MRFWIENRRPGGGLQPVTSIYLYDELGNSVCAGTTAEELTRDLRAARGNRIELRLDSTGGSAEAALRMYVALRETPDLVAHVDGECGSGATILALAADLRYIDRGGSFSVHETRAAPGCQPADSAARDAQTRNMEKVNATFAAVYARRAGGTEQWWRDQMRAERRFTADEAVRFGLAHQVTTDRAVPERLDLHDRFLAGAW